MAERYDEGYRSQVAFVTHTREYRSSEVLPALARHGYTTTERPHDRETERLIAQFDPDLVVLAVDPRHDDDVALVRQVARASKAAILVLAPGPHTTGLNYALEAGADVCLRDTDGPEMLTAQLSALARRTVAPAQEAQDEGPSTITVRDLMLDFDRCQAVREDETIPLTPTEFKILAFLAKNAGKVVSPVEILRARGSGDRQGLHPPHPPQGRGRPRRTELHRQRPRLRLHARAARQPPRLRPNQRSRLRQSPSDKKRARSHDRALLVVGNTAAPMSRPSYATVTPLQR
jgi:DNA-binding response OmpR family regulator